MNGYKVIVVDINGNERELPDNKEIQNLKIVANERVKNNLIKLYEPLKFGVNSQIVLRGINTYIELKSTNLGQNLYVLTGINCVNQKLIIGEKTNAWKNLEIHITDQNNCLYVGNDVMFSKNVSIWTSDGHAIINLDSGKVINCFQGDISIENHVWIGSNVTIEKGITIGHDSVIGACSVVTHSIPNNVVAAGNPANIIRTNISWDRHSPTRYIEKFLK